MGWFERLTGKASRAATEVRDGMYVIRRAELAAAIQHTTEPNFGDSGPRPCDRCARPMDELLITTGGPLGDPAVWHEHPIAVDGWVCTHCNVLHYPRRLAPEQMTGFGREGTAAVRAGRFDDATWWFRRIVWDWPGWTAGYLDLAQATLEGLRAAPPSDPLVLRRRRERARTLPETAVTAHAADRTCNPIAAVAFAHTRLATLAMEDRAFDLAYRELDACDALTDVPARVTDEARRLRTYLDERRDLFDEGAQALAPYLPLHDRAARPVDTPEDRAVVARALEQLEQHHALAPHHWEALWLIAKGRAALGDTARSFDAWKTVWAAEPTRSDVAREYSLALLRADRAAEAAAVARAITAAVPREAALWCNRAVVELLSGELAAAARCLDESARLDPADPIARLVRARLDDVVAGRRPQPRTLRELESGMSAR